MARSNFRPAGMSDSDDSDDDYFCMSSSARSRTSTWNSAPAPVVVVPPDELARGAVMDNNKETLAKLLEEKRIGVNDEIGTLGWSLLSHAASVASYDIMKLLLEVGADVNHVGNAHDLTETKLEECMSLLLTAGADIQVSAGLSRLNPLHFAVQQGSLFLTRKFLDLGIDKDSTNKHAQTALHFAASLGHGRIVRLLILAGADVTAVDDEFQKPCDVAATNNFHIITEMLYRTETTDWSPDKDPQLLSVERPYKESEYTIKFNEKTVVPQRDQIAMILSQLDLTHLTPLFERNNINYLVFLRLRQAHLEEMGVEGDGNRQKILDSIRVAQKRDWEDNSLPSICMNSAITMAETVCILTSTKKHLSHMMITLKKMRKIIQRDPHMLIVGAENAKVSDLREEARRIISTSENLKKGFQAIVDLFTEIDPSGDGAKTHDRVAVEPRSISYNWYFIGACSLLGLTWVTMRQNEGAGKKIQQVIKALTKGSR